MKIIAIAAVTAGGKTTVVNELKKKLSKVAVLHFDDYSFEGEVEDFYKWSLDGADYNVWDLSPLEKDIKSIRNSGSYEYLLLDYPFAYHHNTIKDYIDCAIFIDTPLDIAMARRVLKDILPSSDYVVDGTKKLESIVDEILRIIT